MPTNKLSDALRKIDGINTRVQALEKQTFSVSVSESQLLKIADMALDRIRGDVKRMVVSNFNNSELVKRYPSEGYKGTGKLKHAVMTCDIKGDFRKGKIWKILVLYKPGIAPYEKKAPTTGKVNKSIAYRVFASLNYGAVIPPHGKRFTTTAHAKVKAKKMAAQNRQAYPGLFNGTQEISINPNKNDSEAALMKVIPPKKFFYLNDTQRGQVMVMFTKEFDSILSGLLGMNQRAK